VYNRIADGGDFYRERAHIEASSGGPGEWVARSRWSVLCGKR
jgi:hypothetical protein